MTLSIERARSRRPITWLTLIGVLLLPVIIGGILVAALYNPVERLDSLNAAIVNNDEPVTIDEQIVPLGRQLTSGLVEGSDDLASNLTWTISNSEDAASGLADGTYAAVITIPANFSAAATSTAPGGTPERATIDVQTPPDSLIVDDAITAQVATAAASILGEQLSSVYLENVFLGFTTLGDQLGTAADGAVQLADGASAAADGAAELPGGITLLGDGATQLAGGADQLSDGARQLSSGAGALGSGLNTIAGETRNAAAGANQIADGVDAGASAILANGLVPSKITDVATLTKDTAEGSAQAAAAVLALANTCVTNGGTQTFCDSLVTAATAADQAATGTSQLATGTSQAVDGLAAGLPTAIAKQFGTISSSVRTLGGGLTQLAGGIDQSAAGAGELATGAAGIQTGATGLGTGAVQLADGANQAATGASTLAGGVRSLADGTSELATGLQTAATSIPSYTDAEASSLADVVATPVEADGIGTSLFGASAIPLLAMLALWFGALGTFVALQAVSRRALASRAPSAVLAGRGLLPAAALGAAQGLLVAIVVQIAAGYDFGAWSVFAALAVVAGIAFAAVNQALVAVFGGAGRWVSALIGVLAVATGVVSTAPVALSGIANLMPTASAYNGMVAALTSGSGVGAGFAGLIVWSLLAFIATTIAVVRRRTVSTRTLVAASALPA
ncbi:YhgE/Pip family protein [Microbacterium lacus]|uniref:YhgE/Pip family protein n=1 Tax=Microbacterium lacus TaxID=415217 RepID=UPI00384DE9B6